MLTKTAAEYGRRALAVTPDGPTFRAIHRSLKRTLRRSQAKAVDLLIERREWPAGQLLPSGEHADLVVAVPESEVFAHPQPSPEGGPPQRELRLNKFLLTSRDLVRPGGTLLTVTAGYTASSGRFIDPVPALTDALTVDGGFGYLQHIIAVRAPVQGRQILIRLHPGCPDCKAEVDAGTARAHLDICAFTRL